jgi:hypothetical protein
VRPKRWLILPQAEDIFAQVLRTLTEELRLVLKAGIIALIVTAMHRVRERCETRVLRDLAFGCGIGE